MARKADFELVSLKRDSRGKVKVGLMQKPEPSHYQELTFNRREENSEQSHYICPASNNKSDGSFSNPCAAVETAESSPPLPPPFFPSCDSLSEEDASPSLKSHSCDEKGSKAVTAADENSPSSHSAALHHTGRVSRLCVAFCAISAIALLLLTTAIVVSSVNRSDVMDSQQLAIANFQLLTSTADKLSAQIIS